MSKFLKIKSLEDYLKITKLKIYRLPVCAYQDSNLGPRHYQ